MSTFVLGDTALTIYTPWDASNNPITGLTSPADVVFLLHRQSGDTLVAASETVTMTEIGVTGSYYVKFVPENTGLYTLQYEEVGAATELRTGRFRDISVLSAGSVFTPTYANCFCAESDIERRVQQSISATSTPSDTDTAAFAEERAAVLMSLCARLNYPVTPTTITAGSRLEDMLRAANAIGAARDWLLSNQTQHSQELPESLGAWDEEWVRYVGGPIAGRVTETTGLIEKEIRGNLASLATDYIQSGDTQAPAAQTVVSQPLAGPVGMTSVF